MEKSELKIERRAVLRYLGHRGQKLDAADDRLIDECIARIFDAARPRFIYRLLNISFCAEGAELEGSGVILRGESIRRHLDGCARCAVMAATLGVEADSVISLSEHSSMTRAVILDACATDLIEKVCDAAENEIREVARREGFLTRSRFSAGYGDLPIEHQTELIELLGASKKIGLTVTENNILIPRKSVTAIIGFAKTESAERQDGCGKCGKRADCKFGR